MSLQKLVEFIRAHSVLCFHLDGNLWVLDEYTGPNCTYHSHWIKLKPDLREVLAWLNY